MSLEKQFHVFPDGKRIPRAPSSIEKGKSLATLLGKPAIHCLAHNLSLIHSSFDAAGFSKAATKGLADLALMQRSRHIASTLRDFLPERYEKALGILIRSMTPPLRHEDPSGLEVFFYLPHSHFLSEFGLDASRNGGNDPFEAAMRGNYELTKRFTAEFSIRPFLIHRQKETLKVIHSWLHDPDPAVRRLCSEGTRPRLPWGIRIPAFLEDPSPCIPILEALKDDTELYVRRSVANHLGDIAKEHPELVFSLCKKWLSDANEERKWVIRHAIRYYAKREHPTALKLRKEAARTTRGT